ncbi:uncharacterized protein LOC131683518 isoform X1 [Topomyia yanbarensis]|uniref:uncharacterized protein LOC131683518 isoform X1 n=1 Tax=Topomyia yanbarensis TaxID=2498891 RepID=UPI00273BCB26|nr:uncharacterized protein LOC131683518 isoform X1 [Topomyia yanbarensis]XP_058821540.1 uncharacterized protein LOC131683518 isoform X1 [Topomyia yanbarensis]
MDYRILIVFFLTAVCVKDSASLQRFAEQPKYTEVNPGQDALLVCKVIDKRGVCSWQKDNKPVGIYPKKYEWASQYGITQTTHVGGDCSLWVRAAQLEFDDGLWECQVTASDFTTQDALTSQPVRLVVRVPPQRPRLEHEGVHVPPGHNVTVDAGAMATVKCVSHYGNPPAQLKWFLGDQEISPLHPQINSTEPDNPRTWSAATVVQIPANKDRHGAILKCLAMHESYAARSVAVDARLDVKYAPTIRLLGAPQIDLEEGKDSLILRCLADANPTASIVWRRAGRSEIASLQESLQLRPVGRRDAGLYTCQAQNSVGTSDTLSVQLDVKYAPKILSAGPDRLTTAPLFSPAAFECVAEGNPPPTYKWVQRISTQGKPFLDRGRESRLVIDNVTYDYQGEYECRATNFINGQERTATSDPIALQVVGAPQVLRTSPTATGHSVSVRKGDSATLSLIVCADPRPRHVAWEWGSLRLEAGSGIGRYRVDDVTQDSREDCYLATLHIDDADLQDQRPYYLVVENERGTDRHAINLRVEGMFSAVEPLELSYLLGIAGGCLAAFLMLICLCIYTIRRRKCCFRNRNNYKTSEKDSEKADLKSRSDSTSVPPLDSIYTTPTGFHHHQNGTPGSPEAMKSTTASNTFTTRNNQLYLGENVNTTSNADLVLGALRHQRDLFSGSLGIPDVTTRVGSVIHAFESLARDRQTLERNGSEKPYDSTVGPRYRSHKTNIKRVNDNRHKIILPTPKISPSSTDSLTLVQQPYPRSSSYSNIINSGSSSSKHNNGSSSNNLHSNNNNLGQYFLQSNNHNNHNQTIPRTNLQSNAGSGIHYNLANDNESSNFDSLNLDDDYRKSSFGKQSKLQPTTASIGTLSRNQHLNDATTSVANSSTTNFHSPFHVAAEGNHSRNNPNVFFTTTTSLPQPPVSAQQIPEKDTPSSMTTAAPSNSRTGKASATSPQTSATTMRYYNHDNNNNSSNRRTATGVGGNYGNDDSYSVDNKTTHDKFLRGSTVSQSFIKNVKNMRRKSSSYDLQSANVGLTGGGTANSTSAGFKQRGGALMTSAARHLYKRTPKGPGFDNDTDELTTHNTHIPTSTGKQRESASIDSNRSSGKRKMFHPTTLDRAEI